METIEGIRSPGLTADVDAWIQRDRAIASAGTLLADEIYQLVPTLPCKFARREALAARRLLHKGGQVLGRLDWAGDALRKRLERHSLLLAEKDKDKQALQARYEAALGAELGALKQVVSEVRFQKALCMASPGTYLELADGRQWDWRLIRTLLGFVLRAAGRPTPNGLWSGVVLEEVDCGPVARFALRLSYLEEALGAGVSFPPIYEDAWEALAAVRPKVSWNGAIDQLRAICTYLEAHLEELNPAEFHAALRQARDVVNAVCPVAGQDECVLVADCMAPFNIRVTTELREKIASAIKAAWHFDRMGTGEADAQARRAGGDGADFTTAWEEALAPVHEEPRHRLEHTSRHEPMPHGAALLRLDNAGVRLGCIAPDPALFYGRFHYLFRDAGRTEFFDWYAAELDRVSAEHPDIQFATLGIDRPSDWNAGARPDFTRGQPMQPGTIPLVSSAVSLHLANDCVRSAAASMYLMGRPSLLRPIPVLPRERAEWKHLPRLELGDYITISPERWIVGEEFSGGSGFERFLAWRSYAVRVRLPEMVYVSTGLEMTESLLPCASVLAVEVLARSIQGKQAELRLQEAYPDFRSSFVTCADGKHYAAEIAAAWGGDEAYWAAFARSRDSIYVAG